MQEYTQNKWFLVLNDSSMVIIFFIVLNYTLGIIHGLVDVWP